MPLKPLFGQSAVYSAEKAKGFDRAQEYPIAWEIIFINNHNGKHFAQGLKGAFNNISQDQGSLFTYDEKESDPIRCIGGVFKNAAIFKAIAAKAMKGFVIVDEYQKQKHYPKTLTKTAHAIENQPKYV